MKKITLTEPVLDGKQVGPVVVQVDSASTTASIVDSILNGQGSEIHISVDEGLQILGLEELTELQAQLADIEARVAQVLAALDVAITKANEVLEELNAAMADLTALVQRAEEAASNAGASEVAAKASEVAAKASELASRSSELAAALSAAEASDSEVAAKASEVAAAASQVAAALSETNSLASENAAQASKVASESAKVLAQKYANAPEGVVVEADQYSSFHWAEQAKKYAQQVFVSAGTFAPTLLQPYPDLTEVTRDTIWIVKLTGKPPTFTYTTGPLAGITVTSGDFLFYDTPANQWEHIPVGLVGILEVNGKSGTIVTLTAQDVEALPLSGGTLTGSLRTPSLTAHIPGNIGVSIGSNASFCWVAPTSTTGSADFPNQLAYNPTTGYWTAQGGKIYTTKQKPTASEVGALPTTGGDLTGVLRTDSPIRSTVGTPGAFAHTRGTSTAMFGASYTSGEFIFGGSTSNLTDYDCYVRVGQTLLQYNPTSTTTYDIYHTGNKPTAADVEALPITGGRLRGATYFGTEAGQPSSNPDASGYKVYSNGGGQEYGLNLLDGGLNNASWGPNIYGANAPGRFVYFSKLNSSNPSTMADYTVKAKIALDSGEMYLQDGTKRVYHEANKPTAADIGALPITGGNVTGDINSTRSIMGFRVGSVSTAGESGLTIGTHRNYGWIAPNVSGDVDSSKQIAYNPANGYWTIAGGRPYTTTFKPTVGDIGALAADGLAERAKYIPSADLRSNTSPSAVVARGKKGMTSVFTSEHALGISGSAHTFVDLLYMDGWSDTSGGFISALAISKSDQHKAWLMKGKISTDEWLPPVPIYTEANKPTADDIGVLPTAGGTMTGTIYTTKEYALIRQGTGDNHGFHMDGTRVIVGSTGNDGIQLRPQGIKSSANQAVLASDGSLKLHTNSPGGVVIEKNGHRAMMGCSSATGEYLFGGKANSDSDYKNYIRLGNGKFIYHEDGASSGYNVFHEGNSNASKTTTLQAPEGAESGKYYPVVFRGDIFNLQNPINIDTRGDGGGSPMNNCSFVGNIRSGGWSDRKSYVDGVFTIYDLNERAIHSVWGGSESYDSFAFYVEARAFPVRISHNYNTSVQVSSTDITVGTAVYSAGVSAPTGTKIKKLADFAQGTGRYFDNKVFNKLTASDVNAAPSLDTKGVFIPAGTTQQRPVAGDYPDNSVALRMNTTINELEAVNRSGQVIPIGGGGSGIPALIPVTTTSINVEKKRAYAVDMSDGVNKTITVTPGMFDNDWFGINTTLWNNTVEGLTVTINFGSEVITNGKKDFSSLVIDRPCIAYFTKVNGKWMWSDGAGLDGSYEKLLRKIEELEKYPTVPRAVAQETGAVTDLRWVRAGVWGDNVGETKWWFSSPNTIQIVGIIRVRSFQGKGNYSIFTLPQGYQFSSLGTFYAPPNGNHALLIGSYLEGIKSTNLVKLECSADVNTGTNFFINITIPVEKV